MYGGMNFKECILSVLENDVVYVVRTCSYDSEEIKSTESRTKATGCNFEQGLEILYINRILKLARNEL